MFKKILFLLAIIVISGISGILADRYFFPYLSATDFFTKYKLLRKTTEDVTVINKTEQIYVKEDSSVTKITNQISSSVVNIVSFPNPEFKPTVKNQGQTAVKNGTGVVVTSDGVIMTYISAIGIGDTMPKSDITAQFKYKVMLYDGNIFDATLLAADSYSNLAFLKIEASNLPAIPFANSDDCTAGEKIIAIGNGSGIYQNTFSSGILAGFDPFGNLSGKTVAASEKLEGVFMSDIDNSEAYIGGPVVDYSGQVIGISGMISKDGRQVYFQIPSNKVKTILDKVIKKETDTNPQLGIYYISLNKSYALANNLANENGALIYSPSGQQGLAIIAGTPASKAGLKINDIITAVSDEKITDQASLPDLLYTHKKGEMINLTVVRDRQEMKIDVQL